MNVEEQFMENGNDRRIEARSLTAALVQIRDQYEDASTCVLEDLSPSGALVHTDLPFDVGANVILAVGPVAQRSVVRHCKKSPGGGFAVGIQFEDQRWPAPIHFPVHWITPERS